jgi:hypothetical protein
MQHQYGTPASSDIDVLSTDRADDSGRELGVRMIQIVESDGLAISNEPIPFLPP